MTSLPRTGRNPLTVDTLKSPAKGGEDAAPSTFALTVLAHADLRRVGEVARLDGLRGGVPTLLSRVEPPFAPPGETGGRPLADPCLSRQPVTISYNRDGSLRLVPPARDITVEVDGETLAAPREVAATAIDRGVVIQIASRVVVLLHRLAARQEAAPPFGLVGDSDKLAAVRAQIQRVAGFADPVLVTGETGTGKELVAEALATAGRKGKPFVRINAGALVPGVAALQLFGSARGAYTDAKTSHEGYFLRADGGTLFLDEVGKLVPETQAMLLRVLESKEIQPVGDTPPRRVDVRVVTATDADLRALAAEGGFAQALVHRLGVLRIALPPLRERLEDLGRLLVHFLREAMAEQGDLARLDPRPADQTPWLPADLVGRLARHDWPGNVRELRNFARGLARLGAGQPQASLDAELMSQIAPRAPATPVVATVPAAVPELADRWNREQKAERERIVAALRAEGGNQTRAARLLGISRGTLAARMDQFEIDRPQKRPTSP